MDTTDDYFLGFYIAFGITFLLFVLLFILTGVLFNKVKRLSNNQSNQLMRQTNMMADFCYSNPTIVPGEELFRRGFSMYSGSEITNGEFGAKNNGVLTEVRSKF